MTTISELLFMADHGQLKVPDFQRGWVWKRTNVKELFDSLYHGYPIGSIIVWPTRSDDGRLLDNVIDGQQRISTLYAVLRGLKPPWFKDHDEHALGELLFNLEEERFDYTTSTRSSDPLWVSTTRVTQSTEWWFEELPRLELEASKANLYTQRISKLATLPAKQVFLSRLPDKTGIEDAYKVFRVVNRAGTTVSEGDLALGQISLKWPVARKVVEKTLEGWDSNGFDVPLEWLLHAMAAVICNQMEYDKLIESTHEQIEASYNSVVVATETLQNLLRDQLGFDEGYKAKFNMGLIPILLDRIKRGDSAALEVEREYLAWWLLGTLWRRWSADTRNRVNRDLEIVVEGHGVGGLMQELRLKSEGLSLKAEHFAVKRSPSQSVLKLMRIMTRRCGARSLGNGLGLSFQHVGHLAGLQVHHIFPRALLRKRGVPKKQIDAVANLVFIRHDDNLKIGAKPPADYLPEIEAKNPGVLASQWIPEDRKLWRAERYGDFLTARRALLAGAANDFLSDLLGRDLSAVV